MHVHKISWKYFLEEFEEVGDEFCWQQATIRHIKTESLIPVSLRPKLKNAKKTETMAQNISFKPHTFPCPTALLGEGNYWPPQAATIVNYYNRIRIVWRESIFSGDWIFNDCRIFLPVSFIRGPAVLSLLWFCLSLATEKCLQIPL